MEAKISNFVHLQNLIGDLVDPNPGTNSKLMQLSLVYIKGLRMICPREPNVLCLLKDE